MTRQLTNADLAERLGVIARNLSERGRSFGDDLSAADLTAIYDTIATASTRLIARRVVISPNTALAAVRALRTVAGLAADPGDADTYREIADRIERAAARDRIPDPHVSIAADDEPGEAEPVIRLRLTVEITGEWVNPEVIADTARTLAAQLSNGLRGQADDVEEAAAEADPAGAIP
jgi:hypothetical protein